MSKALYNDIGGLRFWNEAQIKYRDMVTDRISFIVREKLLEMNPAFRVKRCEGPILTPRGFVGEAYDDSDIFVTQIVRASQPLVLRPETTPSSYAFARHIGGKLPLCVWQAGKSFRVEANDGASAAKLRFNEFYQLEFQCIYRTDTKADYRQGLMDVIAPSLGALCGSSINIVESDRLPSYSQSTLDIEALYGEKWCEIASCSIRTDYAPDTLVCEIAIGLDRVVSIGLGEHK